MTQIRRPSRPWYAVTRREAFVHATLAAIVMWTVAAVTLTVGPGQRSIAGPMKWADYPQFYAMGYAGRSGAATALYDQNGLHRIQTTLVPESEPEVFQPTYPPQVALVFAPLSYLPYWPSGLVWVVFTLVAYLAVVVDVASRTALWSSSRRLVLAAAFASPPLWHLAVHGQTTILVLVPFWAAWRLWEANRMFAAGLAFGLLAVKPQFLAPVVILLLAGGNWRVMAGVAIVGVIQVLVVGLALGFDIIGAFAASIPDTITAGSRLEPKFYMTSSIRAIARLLPGWLQMPFWLLAVGAVFALAIRYWRNGSTPLRLRFAVLILATLLVSPHLLIYDATVLVIPILFVWEWVFTAADESGHAQFGAFTYALFLSYFAPTAAFIGLQVSVILLLWLLSVLCSERSVIWPISLAGRNT